MAKTSKSNFFKDVLNGNIFTRDYIVVHMPFFLFLAFLGLLYIANGYLAEDAVRSLNKLDNEIKELRSEYISNRSELMYKSKQSELAASIQRKGLELTESIEPPKKIVIKDIEKIQFKN
jgi:hypothetical protein